MIALQRLKRLWFGTLELRLKRVAAIVAATTVQAAISVQSRCQGFWARARCLAALYAAPPYRNAQDPNFYLMLPTSPCLTLRAPVPTKPPYCALQQALCAIEMVPATPGEHPHAKKRAAAHCACSNIGLHLPTLCSVWGIAQVAAAPHYCYLIVVGSSLSPSFFQVLETMSCGCLGLQI